METWLEELLEGEKSRRRRRRRNVYVCKTVSRMSFCYRLVKTEHDPDINYPIEIDWLVKILN
jgi:hypothetical protein